MKKVFVICGIQGSGKSWACRQVADKFNYIPHDRCWKHPTKKPEQGLDPRWEPGAVSIHFETILDAARSSASDVLTECPFAERQLIEQLRGSGINVVPVFVVEPVSLIEQRYFQREGKPLPKAAASRAANLAERAKEWGCFHGSSDQVLEHLKKGAPATPLFGIKPDNYDKWSNVADAIEIEPAVEAPAADPKPA